MEVEIRLFDSFRKGRWNSKHLRFNDAVQIIDILDILQIDAEEVRLILVNGSHQNVDYNLNDGELLALFPL